jgi:hypothetical protein
MRAVIENSHFATDTCGHAAFEQLDTDIAVNG